MKVSVAETVGLERRMTVEIPAGRIDSEVDARLLKASKTVRIDGFRKGKVPASVVRQKFSEGVRQEVLSELINQTYGEALQEKDLNPAGMPKIEADKPAEDNNFTYTAVFEVYPKVNLKNLGKIKVEKIKAEVAEDDITDMVKSLREQNADWKTVDRACAIGDAVVVDYLGKLDGKPFEGGQADEQRIQLGEGKMIPGFEEGIAGLSAGEEKTIQVTFPDDYQAEDLKGKEAEFDIKVQEVLEKTLPEIDDEFVAKFGVTEGGEEAFMVEVRSNMELELEGALQSGLKSAVMEGLADAHDTPIPKALITEEIQRLKKEMLQQYGQGQELDLSTVPDDPFTEQAERRVKLGLLVSEIVKAEELTAEEQRVKDEVKKIASTYEQSTEVENYYLQNPEALNGLQMKVLEDQVVEFLLEKAKVKPATKTYKEVMASRAQ
jgi:trigger factor